MKISNLKAIANTISRGAGKKLDTITYFVTTKCNLRCKYCFNASALGRTDDLTFEEIKKVFSNFPDLKSIIFSGGEPFIREDFEQILEYLITERKIENIGIPSNCANANNTLTKTRAIVKKYPNTAFVLCVSLDPSEELHNKFRGQELFSRVVQTAKELAQLSRENPNLQVLINSVVTKEAVPELQKFIKFVYTEIRPALHSLDLVRTSSDADKKAFADFTEADYKEILNCRLQLDDMYKHGDLLLSVYRLRTKILTAAQKSCIEGKGRWPSPCLSGITHVVLDANGDFRICENRPVLGNLRNYDFNYKKLLDAANMPQTLKDIAAHKCDCNHIVSLRESIETHFPLAAFNYFLLKKDVSQQSAA